MTKTLTTRAEVKDLENKHEQQKVLNLERSKALREEKIRKKAENIARNEILMANQKAASDAKKAAKRAAHEERIAEVAKRKKIKAERATFTSPHQHWARQNAAGGNFGAYQPGPRFHPGPMQAEGHHGQEWNEQAGWEQNKWMQY